MYCFKSKQNSLYLSSESVFISLSSFTFQPVIGKSAQLFMAYLRIAFITGEFEFRAAPHNLASRFGERFFVKSRFEKRRNTVCISSFSNCGIGGKDPPKCADTIVRCCLRFLRVTSASLLTPITKAQTWFSVDSRIFKDSDFKYAY